MVEIVVAPDIFPAMLLPVLSKPLLLSCSSLPPRSLRPPYTSPLPPQSPALPCHPPSGVGNKSSPCPHFPASLPLRPHSPHPRLCSTCGRTVQTPERSGIRGSAPPQKVEAPRPGRAHMSLAGRFFPSTMRMDSELRLAIAGPRCGVLARGKRVQPAAGGRAGAGRGARGAGRAGLGR